MQHYRAVLAMGAVILPLSACKSSSDQWNLQLFPLVTENQLPFENADTFRIVLERNNGGEEVYEFDAAESVQLEGANALNNTPIRVDILQGDAVAATGRTAPLTQRMGDQELGILVTNTESVAFLEGLGKGLYQPTLTALGDGRFLSTGGLNMLGLLDDGEVNDEIRLLDLGTLGPNAVPQLETIGTLPPYTTQGGETRTGRHAHTASLLTQPEELAGLVLIAGGTGTLMEGSGVTDSAFLLDPETGETSDLPEDGGLREFREDHIAVSNSNGDVVVFGGWTYNEDTSIVLPTATIEFFDADEQRFRQVKPRTTTTTARLGYGFAASMPTLGVLHCGGVGATGESNSWVAVSECILVDLDRNVETATALPVPLAHASMVALSDHEVLVTGGLQQSTAGATSSTFEASNEAWLYDHDTREWSAAGLMNRQRNRHQSIALPDGRVLIAGGRSTGGAWGEHDSSDFEDCLEIYDPTTPTDPFVLLDGCSSSTGSGQALETAVSRPATALDADFGVLIVGGLSNTGASHSVNLWVSAAP